MKNKKSKPRVTSIIALVMVVVMGLSLIPMIVFLFPKNELEINEETAKSISIYEYVSLDGPTRKLVVDEVFKLFKEQNKQPLISRSTALVTLDTELPAPQDITQEEYEIPGSLYNEICRISGLTP